MRNLYALLSFLIFFSISSFASDLINSDTEILEAINFDSEDVHEIDHDHAHDELVFTPEEEEYFFEYLKLNFENPELLFAFPQTRWKECSAKTSGNYTGFNCTNNRRISVILNSYLQNHFLNCVNKGLLKQFNRKAKSVHITHVGIQGDPNHSPRSLHAESRAIDIRSLKVLQTNNSSRTLVYKGTTNRTFYTEFRKCWSQTVRRQNGYPYINGSPMLTGSIGWEDRNHKSHLHVSIPVCSNGSYSSLYFRR